MILECGRRIRMRYFKVSISSELNNNHMRHCYDELDLLYEEVGKRAVVVPDNPPRWQVRSSYDDEGKGSLFIAYVIAFDNQAPIEEIEDIARCSCDTWNVEGGQLNGRQGDGDQRRTCLINGLHASPRHPES